MTSNRFSGSPGIEISAGSPWACGNIRITGNTFGGAKPPAVVDGRGRPPNDSTVVVESNRLGAK